jgi:hypothetical protein
VEVTPLPGQKGTPYMRLAIVFVLLACSVGAEAQGISNARDSKGNLLSRGSAPQQGYPTTPMVNRAVTHTPVAPRQSDKRTR